MRSRALLALAVVLAVLALVLLAGGSRLASRAVASRGEVAPPESAEHELDAASAIPGDALEPTPGAEARALAPARRAAERAALAPAEPAPEDAHLDVLVLAGTAREPLVDWPVQALREGGGATPVAVGATDERGRASLSVPAGSYRVVLPGEAGRDAVQDTVRDVRAGQRREVVFLITDAPLLYVGRAVDARTGDGVACAVLQGLPHPAPFESPRSLAPPDDGAGVFRVEGNAGTVVRVGRSGYWPSAVVLEPGHADEASAALVLLHPLASVALRLLDAQGGALAGEALRLQPTGLGGAGETAGPVAPSATTDASGVALFEGLQPGGVYLPERDGEHERVLSGPPLLVTGEEGQEVVWTLGEGRVEGVVTDEEGRALAMTLVWLCPPATAGPVLARAHVTHATTDERGRFALEDVPAGRWRVLVARLRRPGEPRVEAEAEVEVWAGRTSEVALRAGWSLLENFQGPASLAALRGDEPRAASAPLFGQVTGEGRRTGVARLVGPDAETIREAAIAPGGAFRFAGLAPGRYALVVGLDDGRAALVDDVVLRAPEPAQEGASEEPARERLLVDPTPAARLRVVVADPTLEGALEVRLGGRLVARVQAGDAARDLVLPPGAGTIASADGRVREAFFLAAGEQRDLVLGPAAR